MAKLNSTKPEQDEEENVSLGDMFKYSGRSMVSNTGGSIKRGIGNAFRNAVDQSPALSIVSSLAGGVWGLKDVKKKFGMYKGRVAEDKYRREEMRLSLIVEKLSEIYDNSGQVNDIINEISNLSGKNKDLFYEWVDDTGGKLRDSLGNVLIDFNDTVEKFAEKLDVTPDMEPIDQVDQPVFAEQNEEPIKKSNRGGRREGAGRPKGSKNKPKNTFGEFTTGMSMEVLEKIKTDTGNLVALYSQKNGEQTLEKILNTLTAQEKLQKDLHRNDHENANEEIKKKELNEKILESLDKKTPIMPNLDKKKDSGLDKLLTFIIPMAIATAKIAAVALAAYAIYKNWDSIITTVGDGIESVGEPIGKIAKWFVGDDEDGTLANGDQANIYNEGYDANQVVNDLRDSQNANKPLPITQQNVDASVKETRQRDIDKSNVADRKINENKDMAATPPPVIVNQAAAPAQQAPAAKQIYDQKFLNTRNGNSTYTNLSNNAATYPTNR